MPLTTSDSWPLAVSIRIRGGGRTSALMRPAAGYPSMRGIITSSSTTSGCSAIACSRPSCPSRAVSTSKPAFLSLISTSRSTSGSSSTARTLTVMVNLLLLARANGRPDRGRAIAVCSRAARDGQRERECRPGPDLAVDPDSAAMELHDRLDDRQPEAGAPDLPRERAVDPEESREQVRLVVHRDPHAVVPDRDLDHALAFG